MDIKRLLDYYNNYYSDINIFVDSSTRAIIIEDLRTGSRYYVYSAPAIIRAFKDLSRTRRACGVL